MRVIVVVVLIAVFGGLIYAGVNAFIHSDQERVTEQNATPAISESNKWILLQSTNKIDGTPEVAVMKSSLSDEHITIRCVRRKTELYINVPDVIDNGNVRVRFDDAPLVSQFWGQAADHEALFSPNPVAFAQRLASAKRMLFEYRPFEKGPRVAEFNVSGLSGQLQSIANACNWDAHDKAVAKMHTKYAVVTTEETAPTVK